MIFRAKGLLFCLSAQRRCPEGSRSRYKAIDRPSDRSLPTLTVIIAQRVHAAHLHGQEEAGKRHLNPDLIAAVADGAVAFLLQRAGQRPISTPTTIRFMSDPPVACED